LKDRNLEIPNLKFQIPNFSTLFEIWNLEFGIFIKMAKIKITQVKSGIDRSKRQKATLRALGLRKINHTVEQEATPQILGMVKKVQHLVSVEDS